jgi:hypothetical protein
MKGGAGGVVGLGIVPTQPGDALYLLFSARECQLGVKDVCILQEYRANNLIEHDRLLNETIKVIAPSLTAHASQATATRYPAWCTLAR